MQHELEHLSVTVQEAGEPRARKVQPADFDILRCVGQGAFGKVRGASWARWSRGPREGCRSIISVTPAAAAKHLCAQVFQVMHKHSKQVYAMKVMRKERILQKDHGDYIKSERDLLTTVVHPYIVTLRFSFQVRQQRPRSSSSSTKGPGGSLRGDDAVRRCHGRAHLLARCREHRRRPSCTWCLTSSTAGTCSSTCTARACSARRWPASTRPRLCWPSRTCTRLASCTATSR